MEQRLQKAQNSISGMIQYRKQIAAQGRTIDPNCWSSKYLAGMLRLVEELEFNLLLEAENV